MRVRGRRTATGERHATVRRASARSTRTRATGARPARARGSSARGSGSYVRAAAREPVRAPLAHADAVTPAAAGDHERRLPTAGAAALAGRARAPGGHVGDGRARARHDERGGTKHGRHPRTRVPEPPRGPACLRNPHDVSEQRFRASRRGKGGRAMPTEADSCPRGTATPSRIGRGRDGRDLPGDGRDARARRSRSSCSRERFAATRRSASGSRARRSPRRGSPATPTSSRSSTSASTTAARSSSWSTSAAARSRTCCGGRARSPAQALDLARAGGARARRRARRRDRPPRREAGATSSSTATATCTLRTSGSRARPGSTRSRDRDGARHGRLPLAGAGAGERATPASDRYALGVVAFELLTGERPFAARHADRGGRGARQRPGAGGLGREPALPPQLDPVFERALAKGPAARYRSAGELVGAAGRVDAARRGHPGGAAATPRRRARPASRPRATGIRSAPRRDRARGLALALLGGGRRVRPHAATTTGRDRAARRGRSSPRSSRPPRARPSR